MKPTIATNPIAKTEYLIVLFQGTTLAIKKKPANAQISTGHALLVIPIDVQIDCVIAATPRTASDVFFSALVSSDT